MSLKKGWMDEICSHMIPLGNKFKRKIYRFIFFDNYCYVGLTHNPIERKKAHLTTGSSVYIHMIETGIEPKYEELTDFLDIDDAKKQEEFWKLKSEEEGYLILNKAKTGALGSKGIYWTKEKCKEASLKCKTMTEFHERFSRAYIVSLENNWLDEFRTHMISKYKPNKYWNKERCEKEALKYESRSAYSIGSNSSYDAARRYDWLDEICSHMTGLRKPDNYWNIERCEDEASKYKTKNDLRKNNSYVYKKLRENKLLDDIYKK